MLNSKSRKPSKSKKSKKKKVDTSKETEIIADNAKKSKIKESNAQVIKALQNSNAHTGKYKLLDRSIVFGAI